MVDYEKEMEKIEKQKAELLKEIDELHIQVLVKELYQLNACGGAFHIVTDDDNVEDDSIKWSLEHLEEYADSEEEIKICKKLGEILLKTPEKDRMRIIADGLARWRKANDL